MGNIFAGSEIVEIGIQIEKNGRDFYAALAVQSKNPKAKDIFKYLAGQEEAHIAVFQKILASVSKYEPTEAYPGEYFAYMNALAGESVFTQANKGKEIANKVKDDKEAIDIGIGVEKDSIVFYEGMKKVAPEYDRKVINEVIVQEQGHLTQLLDLKTKF
ncbi:MAG: ferritin family protein [Candidatus Omnitrophica bacterium]|nr:ferritin family protein [Candidatus Omnitrophota bacterium]